MNIDAHRTDERIQPGIDSTLDAAQVSVRRRDVLLAREEKRYVDRQTRKNCLLDRRRTFLRARDLNDKLGRAARAESSLERVMHFSELL